MKLLKIDSILPCGRGARFVAATLLASGLAALGGCGGGQDFTTGMGQGAGGDIAPGFNTALASKSTAAGGASTLSGRGAYPPIETSFVLSNLPGDPFDYEKVNVQVQIKRPDGSTVDVPAFYDGENVWRMRYTPMAPGPYAVVAVKLNREVAHEDKLEKKEWTVSGQPQPGFVRIDRGAPTRFIFDNGGRYFPVGQDQAWQSSSLPDTATLFGKMHDVGENWSRVWMTAWDGKNLDWPASGPAVKAGDIDLAAAKKWDAIVDAAGNDGIYFQMTLQHHGQYATRVDPNWDENPYNVKNGGFLRSPADFFTDPTARALTKRKLYYILARWGYSPNIMAFELFNEVENTDAARAKQWQDIAMWHREMALFLRQYDLNRHLVTTSALPGVALNSPVWETVDYVQEHVYAPDLITALSASPPARKQLDKPIFVGEFGPSSGGDPRGVALHDGVWASLMSGMAGAAGYWDWEGVEKRDLYGQYKPVTAFLTDSGMESHGDLVSTPLQIDTSQRADLSFAPAGGWGSASESTFVVSTDGPPPSFASFPTYLQGQAHHVMMPKPLTLEVSCTQPSAFTLVVGQVAKAGAHVAVGVDGAAAQHDFPAGSADYSPTGKDAEIHVDLPLGPHTITVENTGADWVQVKRMTLANYGAALAGYARTGPSYAAAWIYSRAGIDADPASAPPSAAGKVTLAGLKRGKYQVTWWDTGTGKPIDTTDVTVDSKDGAVLTTPQVTRDVALYVSQAVDARAAAAATRARGASGRAASSLR